MTSRGRGVLVALLSIAGLVILIAALTGGTSRLERIHHVQHQAVAACPATKADKIAKDIHGRPFLSRQHGDCAPRGLKAGLAAGRKALVARPGANPRAVVHGQLGCDLSNNDPVYQGFLAIRANGLTYCWLKTIEGTGFIDHTAGPMRYWADRAGVQVGGYDFAHVCLVSASGEAHFFAVQLRAAGITGNGRLKPALDAEYGGSGCSVRTWVIEWIRQMAVEGFPAVVIYTGTWWWSTGGHAGCWWPSPAIPPWISGYPNASTPCGAPPIVTHQFTDHGHLGGGAYGDENILNGQPEQIVAGPPPPPLVPPEVAGLNARIKTLWSRRPNLHAFGKRDLDYRINRIYYLGWSPHLSGARHDWTGPESRPSQWAKDDCVGVVVRWAGGRHGAYVQSLLGHMWQYEHDRCHRWGPHGGAVVVRLPGNVHLPG